MSSGRVRLNEPRNDLARPVRELATMTASRIGSPPSNGWVSPMTRRYGEADASPGGRNGPAPRAQRNRSPSPGIQRGMAQVREARRGDRDAIVWLLRAQFEEHAITTPADAIRDGVEHLLTHPDAGRLLVATLDGAVVGVAALSFVRALEHGGRSAWL